MEKRGTFRQHLQRNNKNLRFCIGPTTILSSRLLTLVQEGKINSKLYRNTVTYIVNPEVLRATKKSLTSTPKTLDCETPVDSEQLASLLVHLQSALQMLLTRKPKNLTLLIRHTPSHF